jgi:nicotinamide-nucleotide amidase
MPGASSVFAGSVVAYGQRAKESLLGVPRELLEQHGSVHAQVALAMAKGVRWRLGSDVAIAETGVAGPQAARASAKVAGSVALAVVTPEREASVTRSLTVSDRAHARHAFVDEALALLNDTLALR